MSVATTHESDYSEQFFNESHILLSHFKFKLRHVIISRAGPSNAVQEEEDFSRHFSLTQTSKIYLKRFRLHGVEYSLSFHNMDKAEDVEGIAEDAFQELLDRAKDFGDYASITIDHPSLQTPIYVGFQPLHRLSPFKILHEILRVMQSHEALKFDDVMSVRVVAMWRPGGKGRGLKRTAILNLDDWEKSHSRCFLRIQNRDSLCLARAVVVGKAKLEADPQWNSIRQGEGQRHSLQKKRALQLMKDAGLENFKQACGIPELEKIQVFLPFCCHEV